jgi:hypothetical protein
VTEYNEVLSGYQPGQAVEQWGGRKKNNISKTISALRTEVFEMLLFFTIQPLDLADSL